MTFLPALGGLGRRSTAGWALVIFMPEIIVAAKITTAIIKNTIIKNVTEKYSDICGITYEKLKM